MSRWQELRERLEAHGFRPSKKLGQNFLIDPKLARAIATELPPSEALVVEVGAGPGSLTRELLRGRRVLAVEIDARLARFLREESASWEGVEGLRLLECDVLGKTPCGLSAGFLAALEDELARRDGWHCISNLPYSSAGPFVAGVVQCATPPRDGVLLTQWEFGERIVAEVGSPEYGTLSVQVQLGYQPRLLRRVPPDVFRPRPRVDSSLLRLGPAQPWLGRAPAERQAFGRFLQALFASRRKVLRGGLTLAGCADVEGRFERAGLAPELLRKRPGELAPERLFEVFQACAELPGSGA